MSRIRVARSVSPFLLIALAVLTGASQGRAAAPSEDAAKITVHADRKGPDVSPLLYGIFFEDINCSADGGLYAELVRNRSFEDAETPEHWSILGGGVAKVEAAIDTSSPLSTKNKRSLKVTVDAPGIAAAGIVNQGYWGIAVQKGSEYRLSLQARSDKRFDGSLSVALISGDNRTYASARLPKLSAEWNTFQCTLKSSETDPKARLAILVSGKGTFFLDMVSLFPAKTWKDRPNGLRPDLAAMLEGLRPAFVRFPGGCWVEGDTMKFAYRWKETVGDPSERRTQFNIWNYHATHGLGFHEYLQMCEDLGAEPLFVINCGMSHRENVPMDRMGEFVQDALDAIEYCNGPADSTWGSLRARNGHPAPFNLKYLEIGNENGGPAYQERYALFYDAIRKAHPGIVLIANLPTTKRPADIVDEHYYSTPEFFIQQAGRYDRYDRKGPKIYVGEYAVTQGCGKGNLRAAVGEAAFMTGMERNADVVVMSSYAPLFVNVNHRGWNPDLINFDSSRAYGIPSYHVQKLFAENRGDVVLPADVEAPSVEPSVPAGRVGVGTWATQAEFKDLKVTRGDRVLWSADLAKGTEGWKFLGGDWKVEDGALRQTQRGVNLRALAGDPSWKDYTLSLKARKLGGAEGFLILFRVGDEGQKSWWNIGGWGNTRHAIEIGGEIGPGVPGSIETGRWYDIRVELEGPRIRCFLDGKLVHDATPPPMRSLFASATLAKGSGTVILKVVNASTEPLATDIRVEGASKLSGPAAAVVLTSASPADENTLEDPTRVAPSSRSLPVSGNAIQHTFPGNSVTVIRARAE
ncbi:MAG: alpha-L-arabinofuranosidase C-terminal domain-containing protein [Isosphaeraceae bacterium]